MVTWSTERFRSAMISSRSQYVSEYRKYHRTHRRMITSSKCRPRNSAGRLQVTIHPPQSVKLRLQQNHEPRLGRLYTLTPSHLAGLCQTPDDRRNLCRRCANLHSPSACNWIYPALENEEGITLCLSCRLNRTIPDLSVPENGEYWPGRAGETEADLFVSRVKSAGRFPNKRGS